MLVLRIQRWVPTGPNGTTIVPRGESATVNAGRDPNCGTTAFLTTGPKKKTGADRERERERVHETSEPTPPVGPTTARHRFSGFFQQTSAPSSYPPVTESRSSTL